MVSHHSVSRLTYQDRTWEGIHSYISFIKHVSQWGGHWLRVSLRSHTTRWTSRANSWEGSWGICAISSRDTGRKSNRITLTLHSHCTHIAHTLHSHCTHIVLTLHSHCTYIALTLHSHYTHITLTLHSHYTHIALTLHSQGTHAI